MPGPNMSIIQRFHCVMMPSKFDLCMSFAGMYRDDAAVCNQQPD